jgi:hypothetical protein
MATPKARTAGAAFQPCVTVGDPRRTQGRHVIVVLHPLCRIRVALRDGHGSFDVVLSGLRAAAGGHAGAATVERVIKYSDVPIRRRLGFFAAPIRVRRKASSSSAR